MPRTILTAIAAAAMLVGGQSATASTHTGHGIDGRPVHETSRHMGAPLPRDRAEGATGATIATGTTRRAPVEDLHLPRDRATLGVIGRTAPVTGGVQRRVRIADHLHPRDIAELGTRDEYMTVTVFTAQPRRGARTQR